MSFAVPWWLIAVPFGIALVVLVARAGRRSVPKRQHAVAVAMRAVGLSLLIIALAQPAIVRASGATSVLFLLDRSASVDAAARTAQEQFVAAAMASGGPEDLVGVAVFGADVRMDQALAAGRTFAPVRTEVDDSGTDLGGALRGAAAVLPTEGSRRIVVLSDAVETTGDARAAALELADDGIAVDIIVLDSARSSDVLVTAVDAPLTVREGDAMPIRVELQSTTSGPATVTVQVGDETFEIPVELEPGRNIVEVEAEAPTSGVVRVSASVEAGFDTVPRNDSAQRLVRVIGPARVAVVEGTDGEGDDVARALEAGGMEAEILPAIPGADDLLLYDAIVLVNVPAPGESVAEDLGAYVEDLGRGLLTVGGDAAYGLGGYQDTRLEEILPVASNPDDLIRRQPVAEVLVIDTSGSMAACHCGDGLAPGQEISTVNKTDISRAGAGLAINALQPTDRVGVLAFTSGTRWALPLGSVPNATEVAAALGTLVPEGDTEITQALQTALEELRDAPEEIKHMVLFTDGWGEDPGVLDIAREIADAGITLSVLGTGEGSGETLRRMAALGGGRFYPGRDLESVPEVFVEETLRVARPLISEGSFLPALGAASQVTAGLTSAPPLRGYVLTRPKDTAQVLLEVGAGDPLLATWQRGLGRAASWMSDATTRWSADWVTWDGFVDFWGRLIRDVLPPGLDTPPDVRLAGGFLEIEFAAEAPLDAVAIATVRSADGSVTSVPLQRTGENAFTGRTPVSDEGAYWVAVEVEDSNGVVARGSNGVVAGYPDEFAFHEPDATIAADVTEATGGRVEPVAAEVFDPAPLRGNAAIDLWPWLVGIALALFFVDVALRRLVFASGDWQVWRDAVIPRRREPVAAIETPSDDTDRAPDREIHPEEETLGRLLRRKRQ